MKKTNMIMSAAIAGLFATTAHAANTKKTPAPTPTNEEDCRVNNMEWKDGVCKAVKAAEGTKDTHNCKANNSCGANGCGAATDKK